MDLLLNLRYRRQREYRYKYFKRQLTRREPIWSLPRMPDQQNGMEEFKDTCQFSFTEMHLGEADLRTLPFANSACRGGGEALQRHWARCDRNTRSRSYDFWTRVRYDCNHCKKYRVRVLKASPTSVLPTFRKKFTEPFYRHWSKFRRATFIQIWNGSDKQGVRRTVYFCKHECLSPRSPEQMVSKNAKTFQSTKIVCRQWRKNKLQTCTKRVGNI